MPLAAPSGLLGDLVFLHFPAKMVIEALRHPPSLLPSLIHVQPSPILTTNLSLQIHSISRLIRTTTNPLNLSSKKTSIKCIENPNQQTLLTCKKCKIQFDPSLNHPRACRFHTSHFGGETKRKFESVYSGGTMNTPNGGHVLQYWHCCGSEDPFDCGCTAGPHSSYDD